MVVVLTYLKWGLKKIETTTEMWEKMFDFSQPDSREHRDVERKICGQSCLQHTHAVCRPKWVVPLMCEASKYTGLVEETWDNVSSLAGFQPSNDI